MGNKRQLGKKRLAGLLGILDPDEVKRLNHNWLVEAAHAGGHITQAERDGSLQYEMRTCKRYLWSVTKDAGVRAALEQYVQLASRVRTAGSKLINLFALQAARHGLVTDGFLKDTLQDQTFVKYALLPFKLRVSRARSRLLQLKAWQEKGKDVHKLQAQWAKADEAAVSNSGGASDGDDPGEDVGDPDGASDGEDSGDDAGEEKEAEDGGRAARVSRALKAAQIQELLELYERHRAALAHYYPTVAELTCHAWDQTLGDMAIEYIAAFNSHVRRTLQRHLPAYLRQLILRQPGAREFKDPSTKRSKLALGGSQFFSDDLYAYLETGAWGAEGAEPPPAFVTETVTRLRQQAGLTATGRLEKLALRARGSAFLLSLEMCADAERYQWARSWSACPVVGTHRSFAYLDERVMETILKDAPMASAFAAAKPEDATDFEWALGITPQQWNAANKVARQKRRRANRQKNRKRRRREHRRGAGYGACKVSHGWRASSASTDGVALTVLFKRPLRSDQQHDEAPAPQKKSTVDAVSRAAVGAFLATLPTEQRERVQLVAEDPGHVNLATTAQRGEGGRWVHRKTSRADYLRCTLQIARAQTETARRRDNPLLRRALGLMGSFNTCDLERFEQALGRNAALNDILVAEYVVDPWYARWKMLLWRRKRSFLMRRAVDDITAVAEKGQAVLYGVGHAYRTAHTHGAVAVPTSAAYRELQRAARALATRHPVGVVVVDEARTTMTCHGCQQLLEDVRGDGQRALRDVKFCARCVREDRAAERVVACSEDGTASLPAGWEGARLEPLRNDAGGWVPRLKLCIRPAGGQEHSGRLVDRDKNASRNVWKVLSALASGQERPEYLRRQLRSGGRSRSGARARAG